MSSHKALFPVTIGATVIVVGAVTALVHLVS